MIRNIEVINFGSYRGFLGLAPKNEFKKMNLIFGRNYSGKTTLSKIFSYMGTKSISDLYTNPDFTLLLEDGNKVNNKNDDSSPLDVLVFNKDFIQNNLSFLMYQHDNSDNKGTIKSFKMIQIGEEQIKIEAEIKKCNDSLNIQKKIEASLDEISLDYQQQLSEINSGQYKINTELLTLLVDGARQIDFKPIKPKNMRLFNKSHLSENIKTYISNSLEIKRIYTDEQFETKIKDIGTSKKTPIQIHDPINSLKIQLGKIINDSNLLLNKISIRSKPIEFALAFKEWILKGFELHKTHNERICQFCNSPLDEDSFKEFEIFLNQEDEKHKEEMRILYLTINNFSNSLNSLIENNFVSPDNLYNSYQEEYSAAEKEVKSNVYDLQQLLKELNSQLTHKANNIDKLVNFDFSEIEEIFKRLSEFFSKLIEIYRLNNEFTAQIEDKQEELKSSLLEDCVIKFLQETNYLNLCKEKEILEKKAKDLEIDYLNQTEYLKKFNRVCINRINEEIQSLITQKSNSNVAISTINTILNSCFGHEHLELQSYEENQSEYFKVTRNKNAAFNLSEGECTLVAFSYFISKIKNLYDDDKLENYIIYIDDPISSLDNENIFYIYHLIDLYICRTNKYKQLFISTHNLDFFKYLRRLQKPKCKIKDKDKDDVGYYLIVKSKENSKIEGLPNYLRNYSTEFNYLFSRIYNTAYTSDDELLVNDYNIGNDMRKFLEIYYYFKFPCQTDKNLFKERFCTTSDGQNYLSLIERVTNEYSHAEEIFDRTLKPVYAGEIQKVAMFILNRLEYFDEEQYKALKASVKDLILK